MNVRYAIAIGLAALLVEGVLIPGCSGDDTAAPPQGQAGTPTIGSGGGNGNAGSSDSNAGSNSAGDNNGSAGTSAGSGGSGGSGGSNSAGSSGSGGAPQTDASSGAGGSTATEACPMLKDKSPWPAGQAAPCTKPCATVPDGGNDGVKVCAKVAFDSMDCQKAASCKANCTSGDCAVCGACM